MSDVKMSMKIDMMEQRLSETEEHNRQIKIFCQSVYDMCSLYERFFRAFMGAGVQAANRVGKN